MESFIAGVHLALSPEPIYATVNKQNRRSSPDGCSNVSPPSTFKVTQPQITPPPPPPPEFDDYFIETNLDDSIILSQIQQELENQYGGKIVANVAATTIQRAYRSARLQRQFSRLLKLAKSAERLDRRLSLLDPPHVSNQNVHNFDAFEVNVDTGLPVQKKLSQPPNQKAGQQLHPELSTQVPMDEIDRLILQAAGLSTFSSPPSAPNGPSARHIKNRKCASKPNLNSSQQQHQQYLRRTTSLRLDRASKRQGVICEDYNVPFPMRQHHTRAKDDLAITHSPGSSPVPPPCPPLRGEEFYTSPNLV